MPTAAAEMEQIWADSLEFLKSVLPTKHFVETVASLAAKCSPDSIELVAPNNNVRDRVEALVLPLLSKRLPDVSITSSAGGSAPAENLRPGVWARCLSQLATELPEQQFDTWVRPLQVIEGDGVLRFLAPNRFVLDWFNNHLYERLQTLVITLVDGEPPQIVIEVGRRASVSISESTSANPISLKRLEPPRFGSVLNGGSTFARFVEGKSNQLARAAALQVAQNPGSAYNPLFIYGGVGLGKTHLMQAVGNLVTERQPGANVAYVHSERFISEMVRSLQHNTIAEFKRGFRTLDVLLIDDIQFFAGKDRSQEEFFHTFNALLEGQRQVVLSCDRYPKEVSGLEERLKSRFGWGLTVAIEPPELETSVAILMSKAAAEGELLPEEVAFFIAQRIRSNVRELEGALRRVLANSRFTGHPITLDFAKDALRDVLALQAKLVTIENIQKTVAEYFKIRVADLLSKRRSRSVARPRQIAMTLARELTRHSMPEIGDSFGGRDNTTVLHACRTIGRLRGDNVAIAEDYANLLRTLTV